MNNTSRSKKKTTALIIIITVLVLLVVLLITNIIGSFFNDDEPEDTSVQTADDYSDVYFPTPDFEVDKLNDPIYKQLDSSLYYTYGAETQRYIDNASSGDVCVKLFFDYFSFLINGKTDKFNTLFTDSFIESHGIYPAFTQQKIYNIRILLKSKNEITSGEYTGTIRYIYEVQYCILDNDGTYRRDIINNESKAQLIELLDQNGSVKVNSIAYYVRQNANDSEMSVSQTIALVFVLVWIIIAVFAAVFEIITKKLFGAPFIVSALTALALSGANVPLYIQIIVFVLLSAALLAVSQLFIRKKIKLKNPEISSDFNKTDKSDTNTNDNNNDRENKNG